MDSINDANFQDIIKKSDKPVLVDFWADWCMPCKMIAPILEELNSEYKNKINIVKMNIDENTETPQQYGITSIPTIIIFKEGNAVETLVGALPKNQLQEILKKHI